MTEVAAHITDHVLPQLPVRQWVLSLPKRLRPFLIWAVEFPIRLSVRRITQRDLLDSEDSHFLLEAEQPRDL
jgi:DNA polymerase III psi subunit